MPHKFIMLSLLVSLPISAMQRPQQAAVKYAMQSHFYKKYVKDKADKTLTLGMFTGVLEGVKQAAQDQGTINTVLHVGQVATAVGTIGFIAAAPPFWVGCAFAGVISYMTYESCTSSSTPSPAPVSTDINPSWPTFGEDATIRKYEAQGLVAALPPKPPKDDHHHRHDPHPEFHPQEFKDDRRVKENYRERHDGALVLKDGANTPFKTQDGKDVTVLKIDGETIEGYVNNRHVGELEPVSGTVKRGRVYGKPFCSKGTMMSEHTIQSQRERDEYYSSNRTNNWQMSHTLGQTTTTTTTTTQVQVSQPAPIESPRETQSNSTTRWEMSYSLPIQSSPIESPCELHGQASYDLHYSPNTTTVWSQSWKIGE